MTTLLPRCAAAPKDACDVRARPDALCSCDVVPRSRVLGGSASVGALLADDATAVCATPRLLVAHALQPGARSGSASGSNDPLAAARPASAAAKGHFAALSEGARGVSALARSPDGASIAAAERGGGGGVLLVDAHTLARRATLTLSSSSGGAVRPLRCCCACCPRVRFL
jgi:hypothetical protein